MLCLLGCIALLALTTTGFAQTQNPFALGGLEGRGGAPAGGIAGFILAKQAEFTRAMTAATRALRTETSALWTLVGLGFAYGVLHAAGPGHGKAIIASYVVANEQALKRGVVIALAAALLQGAVAIALVGAVAVVLGGTRQMLTGWVNTIELVSYAAIAMFGVWLLWRKGRALIALARQKADATCDHWHMPGPSEVSRWSMREAGMAVMAAGMRPCTGAILILVFTLSQGLFWAGMLAVLAMAIGVALTTGGLAALAVYLKTFAISLASGRGRLGLWLLRSLEVLAALVVILFGLALLSGQWTLMGGG